MSAFNGTINNLLLLADHIEEHCPTTAQGCRDGATEIAKMQERIAALERVAEAVVEARTDDPATYIKACKKRDKALRAAGYLQGDE